MLVPSFIINFVLLYIKIVNCIINCESIFPILSFRYRLSNIKYDGPRGQLRLRNPNFMQSDLNIIKFCKTLSLPVNKGSLS